MKNIIVTLSLLLPINGYATATLYCTGEPLSFVAHIGTNEDGSDNVSDFTLIGFEENRRYAASDFKVKKIIWNGLGDDMNIISLESVCSLETSFEVMANNTGGKIIVDKKEYSLSCDWDR